MKRLIARRPTAANALGIALLLALLLHPTPSAAEGDRGTYVVDDSGDIDLVDSTYDDSGATDTPDSKPEGIPVTSGDSEPTARGDQDVQLCEFSEVTIVGVQGSTGGPLEIVGTKGDDVILGSSGPDIIKGLGGDDIICGAGGDDVIDGGSGFDQLDGGSGERDVCNGGLTGIGRVRDTAINCESTIAVP